MVFIETVPEAEAKGRVAEIYDADREDWGFVPNFSKVFALRPGAYAAWDQLNGSIRGVMDRRRYELATVARTRAARVAGTSTTCSPAAISC